MRLTENASLEKHILVWKALMEGELQMSNL